MKKLVEFFRRLYFRTFITHNDNHDYKNFIFLSSDERENSISNKTFFDQKYIIKTISQFLPSNYVLKIYQHDYKLINSKSIDYFKEINCFTNVYFVKNNEDIKKNLSNCSGIFLFNSNLINDYINFNKKIFIFDVPEHCEDNVKKILNIIDLKKQIELAV